MSQAEDYLAHSFREVDAGDTGKMMRCLTFMDRLPVFQRYKSAIMAKLALRPGATVADLGCGLGFDVHHFAALVGPKGKALGIDASHALLLNANAACKPSGRACFIQANIQHLPLADASLDACKVDRTLQHVEEPPVVLNEILRTLRPGGLLVCSEPDWSTFVIADPDRMASQISAFFYRGFRNPRIGYELKSLLETAGFVDLQTEEVILSTTGFASSDIVFDLTQSAARLAENSKSEEPLAWLANLRQRLQPLFCSVNLVIQFARRP
jgi:ubiquinone/menaquinone biosynthesis C-methylase UbiE